MINFLSNGKTLKHSWSKCVGAGRAYEGLRADWQNHLKTATNECGFQYLRFHGLFHDDMHIYKIIDGKEVYNYQYVDSLFDYMLDFKIRPFVEFGFMPSDIASGVETVFWWKSNITPPKDYQQWKILISNIMLHWIDRYGINEVKKWYFEVWNEPNLPPFWSGTKKQYFQLYKDTVTIIKDINKELRVGGPATSNFVPDERFDGEKEDLTKHKTFKVADINTLDWKGVWIEDFIKFCENENLPIDFISTHPYPTDFALDGYGKCNGLTRHKNSLSDDILWLKNIINNSKYKEIEIHLTEWSSSPTSRDYSHDYLPASAYVMHSNLQVNSLVDSLSYWVFTDVFEEAGAGPEAFHGGFGLINLQGIKKPTFYAYNILNQLGNIEIAKDNGYVITKKDDDLICAFYNYPDDCNDTVPMSVYPDQEVAKAFQNIEGNKTFNIEIENLEPKKEYTLQIVKKDNIAIKHWNNMGAPNSPTKKEIEILKEKSQTLYKEKFVVNDNGILKLDFVMESWEIGILK